MRKFAALALVAALAVCPVLAQPKTDEGWIPEPGLISAKRQAVNLEVGGMRMTAKVGEKLAQGATCLIDENTIVRKVGEEADGRVIVRALLLTLVQTDPAFCPQNMPFHLTLQEWADAKNAFDKKYSLRDWIDLLRKFAN